MAEKNYKNQSDTERSVAIPSTMGLRGRQSVRATFRLSEACIDAITVLSAQLGIKQKSVFEHIMEDAQMLKDMARELANVKMDPHERIQKPLSSVADHCPF